MPLWAAAWSGVACGRAAAQAHELDLRWSAPAECPDRRAVVIRMAKHWPKAAIPDPSARAEAQILREGRGYRLDLQLWTPSPSAVRSLTGPECSALAEAAALLIALTFESDASPSPSAPEVPAAQPAQRAEPQSASAARGVPSSPPAREPPAREQAAASQRAAPGGAAPVPARSRVGTQRGSGPEPRDDAALDAGGNATPARLALPVSAALRFDSGMLPQTPAIGLQARVGVQLARLSVALGVTYWAPAQVESARYPTARLTGRGTVSDLAVGFELLATPLRVTPVLSLELGQVGVTARGISTPAGSEVLWVAGGAGLESTVEPLPNFELGLELLGLAPWPPPRWLVRTPTGDVAVFRAAPLTLHLSLRIGYVFR